MIANYLNSLTFYPAESILFWPESILFCLYLDDSVVYTVYHGFALTLELV